MDQELLDEQDRLVQQKDSLLKDIRAIQKRKIKELDELPASDVLSNHQIDDWMRKSEDPEEPIHDQDVGLAPEPNPAELPLDEPFAEIDWQKENAESDAAEDLSPPEVS